MLSLTKMYDDWQTLILQKNLQNMDFHEIRVKF